MAFEIENEGQVLIFESKDNSGKKPDYYGYANVDGEQKHISLWANYDEEGNFKSFGGFIKEPYVAEAKAGAKSSQTMKPRPKPQRR